MTQLGGHPQNWNSIASECITQLKAFTVELAHFNAKTMIELTLGVEFWTVLGGLRKMLHAENKTSWTDFARIKENALPYVILKK